MDLAAYLSPYDHTTNSISIGSAILAQLMVVVNRHTDCDTDTPHYISIERLHLYTLCMQCGLKIKRATS